MTADVTGLARTLSTRRDDTAHSAVELGNLDTRRSAGGTRNGSNADATAY
jgi:hypothetical protein